MPRFSIGIYHNGESAPFCSTSKLTQNESFMGQNFVSTTIDSPTALGFKVGDYLTYRGRKFVLAVTPSMQKNARVNSVGNAIKYDNIKFISVASDELTRCEFRDVVNSTKDHYNFAARTFSFHCLTLKDYAERLKANLDRMYSGYTIKILLDNGSTYTIGSSTPYNGNAVGEKNKVIQISNETCWDSLQHVKTDFKVNLYFDGDRTIILGANGHLISQHHFAYGAGEGLFKISRTTDESQAIITRLRAYGSEKNMPTRFYANLKYLYLLPKEMITEAQTSKTKIDLVNGTTNFENDGYITIGFDGKMLANSNLSENNKFKSTSNGADKYLIKVRINNVVGWMNIQYNGENYNSYANIGWNNASEYGNNTETSAKALIEEFCKMQWTYFIIEDGATSTWKYKVTDPSCTIPNNMNVKCLMLAGFGFNGNSLRDEVKAVYDRPNTEANKKLIARLGYATFADFSKDFTLSDDPSDPYIDAVPQKKAYGVREGTIVFDGSSDDYDEIYPSIEYMGGIDDCPAQKAKVDGSDTYEGNNLRNDGGVVDDLAEAGKEIPQFYLYIKDPSFDPYEYRKSGSNSFKINMIDGMCGGRSFDVKQAKKCRFEDGSVGYRLICDRVEDNSLDLYFPYSQIQNGVEVGYVIKAGDKYTFSDIEMPSEYVLRTALYELFPAAVDALKKNRDVRFKYELSVDSNEMYRQHILSLTDDKVESIHDTIHAGDLILFGDKDLGVNYDENEPNPITGSVIINSIEIKENNERLPQYTIQLVDEKTIGTIERIQRQIEYIMGGSNNTASGSSVSGYAASEIQGLIKTYGANYFLSKTSNDTAKGDLTFDGKTTFNGDMAINGEVNFGNSLFKGTSGAGIWKDSQGNWHIQTDFLDVNYALTAKSIEIQEEKHIGGCQIITGAGCTIDHVDEELVVDYYNGRNFTAYRCYFLAVDPDTEKEITNDWRIGDQARCQTFNVKNGAHYYWRLVIGLSEEPVEIDGKKYHYFDLFAGSQEGVLSDAVLDEMRGIGSSAPMAEDDVILLGSRSGIEARENAIIIAGAGTGSPYIREYAGIKTFSLNGYCEISIEPKNSFLKVKSLKIVSSDGEETDLQDKLENISNDILELASSDGTLDEKIAELLAKLNLSQQEIDDLKDDQDDIFNQLDRTYEFWHVDWSASFDADGNVIIPSITSVEPCKNWGTKDDPYSEHVGDFIITSDGICFQFEDTETDGVYVLVVRSDKYLLAAMAISTDNKLVLTEMANDGIITPQEKTILSNIWTSEKASCEKILTDNSSVYGSSEPYSSLRTKYRTLSEVMAVVLSNSNWDKNIKLSEVSAIPTGKTFEGVWNEYYEAYESFDKYVKDKLKQAAKDAQDAADEAKKTLEDIANDGVITIQEHNDLSDIWDNMTSQYNQAIANADKYSTITAVSTAKTNLTTAYNSLKALVEAVLARTTDYTIVPSYKSAWSVFFTRLEELNAAITSAAKKYAEDAADEAAEEYTEALEESIKQYLEDNYATSDYVDKKGFFYTKDYYSYLGNAGFTLTKNDDGTYSVSKINGSGVVTTSNFASLFSTEVDSAGLATTAYIATAVEDGIAKAIIKADQISFDGVTSFNSGGWRSQLGLGSMATENDVKFANLAQALKNLINSKLDSTEVGDLAYLDKVDKAMLDSTIISGGFILTSLIDVDTLYVKHLNGAVGDIGGWTISKDNISNEYFTLDNNGVAMKTSTGKVCAMMSPNKIGDFSVDDWTINSATNKNKTKSCSAQIYIPAIGAVVYPITGGIKNNLGYFDANSTLSVQKFSVSFTMPSIKSGGASVDGNAGTNTTTLTLTIYRDGVEVEKKTYPATYNITSGNTYNLSLGSSSSYALPQVKISNAKWVHAEYQHYSLVNGKYVEDDNGKYYKTSSNGSWLTDTENKWKSGVYSYELTIKNMGCKSSTGTGETSTFSFDYSITYSFSKGNVDRTFIFSDGIISMFNGNSMTFTKDGFRVQFGYKVFGVDSTGAYKSSDGGSTKTTL